MLVNKSMFPVQAGYNVISKMNDQLGKLQTQLGTQQKASSLAEMIGGDRANSLSLRARLTKLTAYADNMTTVNMRLNFLDQAFTSLSKIKSEARTAATPGSYGENNLVMVNLQKTSQDRLSLVIDTLNAQYGGRYLMGGNVTDSAPVKSYNVIMNGQGGSAGLQTVVNERKQADLGRALTLGDLGLPKVDIVSGPVRDGDGKPVTDATGNPVTAQNTVMLKGDGMEQLGYKLNSFTSSTTDVWAVAPDPNGNPTQIGVSFNQFPLSPSPGDTVTLNFTKPDGTDGSITLTATNTAPAGPGQFVYDPFDENVTAQNFQAALQTELSGLEGPQLGRLDVTQAALPATNTTTITQNNTVFGYQLSSVSTDSAKINVAQNAGPPATMDVKFAANPKAGESVSFELKLPDGTTTTMKMTAVLGAPGPGEFQIGADAAETSANFTMGVQATLGDLSKTTLSAASTYQASNDFFSADGHPMRVDTAGPPPVALEDAVALRDGSADTVIWYTGQQSGNARLSATAQIDDTTKVGYGVRANEDGLLQMVRTLASMSIESYPTDDVTSKGRFDAMVERQMSNLSSDTAAMDGSVEGISLELGVVKNSIGNTTERNTAYAYQLETMLTDVENVNMEQTAMELLALKTRLEASYQTTASVAQLSLVNYLR
ncbi:hypothetical protein XM25_10475 [Devosia sp. H5989]|nr:hypothetical protein XM25_10475 [Devosia sp. H5989]